RLLLQPTLFPYTTRFRSGSPAKGAIEVIGEALHGGVIHLYIAGIHLQVVVPQGADSTKVNTLIANAINEATLPVIAAVNDKSVELTARWSGETGNEITILTHYHTRPKEQQR